MSIIQISKIQQRSGDLVDLPQLDEAEFGFASDEKRLFIGKTTGNTENVEVLTAYSDIGFDQIDGAVGNLDITGAVANGQLLVFDSINWTNRGGNAGGLIDLGDTANIKISGGGIDYVLTTDGLGNLSWSPKSTIVAYIQNVTQANPGVVTTTEDIFLVNGAEITITGVNGMTQLNGNSYFIGNLTNNSFALYTDVALTNTLNTSAFGAYTSGGQLVSVVGGSEGSANAGGALYSIQYNYNGLIEGSANLKFDFTTSNMTLIGNLSVSGTANVGNLIAANANIGNLSANTANFANLSVSGPTVTTAITTGAVGTAGTITGNWTLTAGSRLTATYADLAEYYCADNHYPAGTVLDFGGEYEVTLAGIESNKIAGVVSADPAYVMNGMIQCDNPVTVALQGRVPCKVKGKVHKGDMMVSAGNGFAKAATSEPKMGTVIGKALANFDGEEGVIEVVVGRL